MGNLAGAVQVQEVQSEGDWTWCSPVPSIVLQVGSGRRKYYLCFTFEVNALSALNFFFPHEDEGFLTHFLQVLPGNV